MTTIKKTKKNIPPPVDVKGRKVSWQPSVSSHRLYGEVLNVSKRPAPHPKYPNTTCRVLKTVLHIVIPDGRVFQISGDHEYLKKIDMIAESPEAVEL